MVRSVTSETSVIKEIKSVVAIPHMVLLMMMKMTIIIMVEVTDLFFSSESFTCVCRYTGRVPYL